MENKQIILSGAQPSGSITIGNYLGALKNWVKLQDSYDSYFFIADLHSITVNIEPQRLFQNTIELAAVYLACGLDPNKSTLFVQSSVSQHAELCWTLNCYTYYGEAKRMIQFKEKSRKNEDNVNVGLFDYPVLQAADILLYQPDLVPIGKDQGQHLELARNVADRFNKKYNEQVFKIPQAYIAKQGAKIMSLTEPKQKMSKSDSDPNSYILITDSPEVILQKIKKAVTDSGNVVAYAADKAGVSNLLTIYGIFTGKSPKKAEADFVGCGYGKFKAAVGEAIIEGLRPVQDQYHRILNDRAYLLDVLKAGAQRASQSAQKTLDAVYNKIGFVRLK